MSSGLESTLTGTLLLWGIALPCFWHSMELLLKGEFRQSPRILIGFVVGFGSAYGGATLLGWVTPEVGRSLAGWLQPITSDARWALLVWFLFFVWLGGPGFMHKMRGASLNALSLADEDAPIMEQRIWYWGVGMNGTPELTGPAPHVDFHINFINAAVFEVTWEEPITGRIRVEGQNLQDALHIREPDKQQLQTRRAGWNSIAIRQPISETLRTYMLQHKETKFEFRAVTPQFSFYHRGQKRKFGKSIAIHDNVVTWTNTDWQKTADLLEALIAEAPPLVTSASSSPTSTKQPTAPSPPATAPTGANILQQISALADQGTNIQEAWIRTNDTATLIKQHDEWSAEGAKLLANSLGASYSVQFKNAHGSAWMGCPDGHSVQGCGYWQDIQGKRTCS
jgi:hypothetical protein